MSLALIAIVTTLDSLIYLIAGWELEEQQFRELFQQNIIFWFEKRKSTKNNHAS